MKKILLLLLSKCLFLSALHSQTYNGSIWLSSQHLVDSIGTLGYQEITGSLYIGHEQYNNYVNDLTPLTGLKKVGGYVHIFRTNLQNLQGLNQLDSVGYNSDYFIQDVIISYNTALQNIDALNNLSFVGTNIGIFNNQLQSFNALSKITRVNGNLYIRQDSMPANLDSLIHITYVAGKLGLGGIDDLQGLANVDTVGGELTIFNTNTLSNLDAFENLKFVGQGIHLYSNHALKNIDALQNLAPPILLDDYHDYDITINGNDSLENLDGLRHIKKAGQIQILNNPSLLTLSGFDSLTYCYELTIENNDALVQAKFPRLRRMNPNGYPITITGNASLQHINGFNRFLTTTRVIISDNDRLQDITGFKAIDSLGSLTITENDSLLHITGFSHARKQTGELKLVNNPLLSDISGFFGLQRMDGSFFWLENSGITDLSGFDSLTVVNGGGFSIQKNTKLEKITGFNHFHSTLASPDTPPWLIFPSDIGIGENPLLTEITGFQSLDSTSSLGIGVSSLLTNIEGFSNINYIANGFSLNSNATLVDLFPFSNLKVVKNSFFINAQNNLPDLNGFQTIHEIGGEIFLGNNNELNNTEALNSIEEYNTANYGTSIGIVNNPALISLNGLQHLTRVGGGIIIRNNASLTDISALSNLRYVHTDTLDISGNASLASLHGLEGLDTLTSTFPTEPFSGGTLKITNNASLTDCSALCIVLDSAYISSGVFLQNNPFPCGLLSDVEAHCDSLALATSEPSHISASAVLYLAPNPNPTHAPVHVTVPTAVGLPCQIGVFNASGSVLMQQNMDTRESLLILNGYAPGLYFVRASDTHGRQAVGKLMILSD